MSIVNNLPEPSLVGASCPKCNGINISSVGEQFAHSRIYCNDCAKITGLRPVWTWPPEWMYRFGFETVWDQIEFDIRDSLFGLCSDDIIVTHKTPTKQGTRLITEAIETRARYIGLDVLKEEPIQLPKTMQNNSGWGRVDILLRVPVKTGGMVIEIDSEAKTWSMDKLLYCYTELNLEVIWIRWHSKKQRYVPTGVRLIDLWEKESEYLREEDLYGEKT